MDRKDPNIPDRTHYRLAMSLAVVSALIIALAGSLTGAVRAATHSSAITYLGPPMNIASTNQYFPLDGFHRVPAALSSGGKPELLFLGSQGGIPSFDQINVERWPLIKALDQFGTLSGVQPTEPGCMTLKGGMLNGQITCGVASFDLSRAHYTSRYLTLVSKDLVRLDKRGGMRAFQRPTPAEWALFTRYVAGKSGCYVAGRRGNTVPCKGYAEHVAVTIGRRDSEQALPLLVIGNYLQTLSQIVQGADFKQSTPLVPPGAPSTPGTNSGGVAVDRGLLFASVRGALASGHNPVPGSSLVKNVNAEANIITALICHADHFQPKAVCGRFVIKAIVKHVR